MNVRTGHLVDDRWLVAEQRREEAAHDSIMDFAGGGVAKKTPQKHKSDLFKVARTLKNPRTAASVPESPVAASPQGAASVASSVEVFFSASVWIWIT